jgi:alkyldihydroxyacetonephosphate synthase
MLREELGVGEGRRQAVALAEVRLPEPSLPAGLRDRLAGEVRDDRLARVTHAVGKSYTDLVRLRAGEAEHAPDAVVYPGTTEEVRATLAACAEAEVAVVPFGGGTSVVGGVEPLRDGHAGAVSLDLARLVGPPELDRESALVVAAPGLTGPRAEALLQSRGVTLGHYPQSFEFATLGGFAATRSAGQASTGMGRFDELVRGLRLVAPAGELALAPHPGTAAGPQLRELALGSEGVLGVICELTLAVRPLPERRHYEAWLFRSFTEGAETFRALEQEGLAPDVARLSDEPETRLSLALASSGSLTDRAGRAYLRVRGRRDGCLAILGWEGDQPRLALRRGLALRRLRQAGGMPLGARPGAAWYRSRFSTPYLRDELLDRGVLAETLETATTWTNLLPLHRAVGAALREALAARGTPPLVGCHVSHLYRTGASLYFTVLARQQPGEELEQWRSAKQAAGDAIVAHGGTITHHHAVGSDHAPWMPAEVGESGLGALRAVKARLDPSGIMNPGKLLPT